MIVVYRIFRRGKPFYSYNVCLKDKIVMKGLIYRTRSQAEKMAYAIKEMRNYQVVDSLILAGLVEKIVLNNKQFAVFSAKDERIAYSVEFKSDEEAKKVLMEVRDKIKNMRIIIYANSGGDRNDEFSE